MGHVNEAIGIKVHARTRHSEIAFILCTMSDFVDVGQKVAILSAHSENINNHVITKVCPLAAMCSQLLTVWAYCKSSDCFKVAPSASKTLAPGPGVLVKVEAGNDWVFSNTAIDIICLGIPTDKDSI